MISVGYRAGGLTGRIIMTKPTYEELLEALFGVTQALRNTLLHACNMTDAEKDQRWTITHRIYVRRRRARSLSAAGSALTP